MSSLQNINIPVSFRSISLLIAFIINTTAFASEEIRFHPLEKFQIKYVHEGMMTGDSVLQCRKWCHEMVNTINQSVSMMGITQTTNQKTITIEDKIFNIDQSKGTVTEAENPMYNTMVQAGQNNGGDPMAFAQHWMDALGYQPTGNSRTILDEECQDYNSPQLANSTVCMTLDGLTLRMEMNMGGGISSVQTATEINRGNGGEDTDYVVPAGAKPIEAMPGVPMMDMDQLQDLLKNL